MLSSTSAVIELDLNRLKRSLYSKLQLSGMVKPNAFYYITDDPTVLQQVSASLSAAMNADTFVGGVDKANYELGYAHVWQNGLKRDLSCILLTREQYDILKAQGKIATGCYYYITDDPTVQDQISNSLSGMQFDLTTQTGIIEALSTVIVRFGGLVL